MDRVREADEIDPLSNTSVGRHRSLDEMQVRDVNVEEAILIDRAVGDVYAHIRSPVRQGARHMTKTGPDIATR